MTEPYQYKPNPDWWLAEWTCPVCLTTTRKHHKARHVKSRAHLEREQNLREKAGLVLSQSDIDFSVFLANFDPRRFKGPEKEIYAQAQKFAQLN